MGEIFYPQVDLPSNFTARVMMRVPPGLDPNAVAGYPMIVSVYAGPNDRNVDYRYVAGARGSIASKNSLPRTRTWARSRSRTRSPWPKNLQRGSPSSTRVAWGSGAGRTEGTPR